MASEPKTWFDRILRAEGAISFGAYVWNGIGLAVGGGVVTGMITWLQGALSPYGFGGFVVVALLVSILILTLAAKINEYRERRQPKASDTYATLEVAAYVYRSRYSYSSDIIPAARQIIQLAADGSIDMRAAKIEDRPPSRYFEVGPTLSLSTDRVQEMSPVLASANDYEPEVRIHGRVLLTDGTSQYGRVTVNLTKLVPWLA
jgi:hypothetical protein